MFKQLIGKPERLFKLLLFLSFSLLWTGIFAQFPSSKIFYSSLQELTVSNIISSNDGGYYVSAGIDDTDIDILILKLDAQLDTIWTKRIGSNSVDESGTVMTTASNGDLYILGWKKDPGGWSAKNTASALFKITSNGKLVWTKVFDPLNYNNIFDIELSGDTILRIGGAVFPGVFGSYDAVCVELDTSGNLLRGKLYGTVYYEEFTDIQTTSDGGFIGVGRTSKGYPPGSDSSDFLIAKFDASLNQEWVRVLKTSGRSEVFPGFGSTTVRLYESGYLIVGTTDGLSVGGDQELVVFALGFDGDTKWARRIGDAGNEYFHRHSVFRDYEGFSISLIFDIDGARDKVWMHMDTLGNNMWAKKLGEGINASGFGRPLYTGSDYFFVSTLGGYLTSNREIGLMKANYFTSMACLSTDFTPFIKTANIGTAVANIPYDNFSIIDYGTFRSETSFEVPLGITIQDSVICEELDVLVTADSITCQDQDMVLSATGDVDYTWYKMPGLEVIGTGSSVIVSLKSTTTYLVEGMGGDIDTIVVDVIPPEVCTPVKVYGYITPDGNGQNDYFEVENINFYPKTSVVIYNRWGDVVFEDPDYTNTWDGEDMADGTYYYVVTIGTTKKILKGALMISR